MNSEEFLRQNKLLLKTIQGPDDLKPLSIESLKQLASEVRELIIDTVSRRGGHLASSLGVVELTIALLKVFSPPHDRLIFDVGHQSYAYKILTGRRDLFQGLRTRGGIAGFPKRSESEYDFFDVGHAGNAISVAAGLAQARCFDGDQHKVIAIVGDGSLTCGVSYEGLNQAGAAEKDLIIILNDNEMSISPNVGAIAAYLNRIMTGQLVTRFRDEVKNVLKNIPGLMGRSMYSWAKQFEEALKGFVTPGRLFEDLGFNYVGPIDGHQIKHLVDTFQNVKRFKEPVLVHTITCKGKGYRQAEQDPSSFHGVGPFDRATGSLNVVASPPATYTSVFGKTMVKLGSRDQKLVAITAAMEYGTGLADFARLFPKRFFDVGIAEQHGVVFAGGLASEGYKPVVAIYSTFMQRGYDHLIHDVCMQEHPVVFAMDRAGIVGEDGPTHHGVFDIAFCRHIPNLIIMAPSDENELADMLASAISWGKPCVIRYPRAHGLGVQLRKEPQLLPLRSRLITPGDDVVIIAIGSMVAPAIEASKLLAQDGFSAAVIDARFIKPLDRKTLVPIAAKAGLVVTVEEGILAGGFGSAILELFQDEGLTHVRVSRMGVPDKFIEHGTREELLEDIGLVPSGIADQCRKMIDSNATIRQLRVNVGG